MRNVGKPKNYHQQVPLHWFMLLLVQIVSSSCSDFLEVPGPKSRIDRNTVFNSESSAELAVIGVYSSLIDPGAFSYGVSSITMIAGLSADELQNYPRTDPVSLEIEENNIHAQNGTVLAIWTSVYRTIYLSNAAIEGLTGTTAISPQKRSSLEGECLFIRAFCYFYLLNLFGDVPLVTSTDYNINSNFGRSTQASVWNQIKADLLAAQLQMPEEYDSKDRTRVSRACATALLARVYLYQEEWSKAEEQATIILQDGRHTLNNLDDVFLANSMESIWQLRPGQTTATVGATPEASYFLPPIVTANNILRPGFIDTFEPNDLRRAKWIGKYLTIYHPFKYKQNAADKPLSEYSMVMRLAEQYLIRAEARAMMGKLIGIESSASDLDSIRHRAGLNPTTAQTQDALLIAIMLERRHELFTEWGHRWFDLKRTKNADDVLSGVKPKWSSNDMLYPIPQTERNKNRNLSPQNPGY